MQQKRAKLILGLSEINHKFCFLSISELAIDEVLQASHL